MRRLPNEDTSGPSDAGDAMRDRARGSAAASGTVDSKANTKDDEFGIWGVLALLAMAYWIVRVAIAVF